MVNKMTLNIQKRGGRGLAQKAALAGLTIASLAAVVYAPNVARINAAIAAREGYQRFGVPVLNAVTTSFSKVLHWKIYQEIEGVLEDKTSDKIVFVQLGPRYSCMPCKALDRYINQVKQEFPSLDVRHITYEGLGGNKTVHDVALEDVLQEKKLLWNQQVVFPMAFIPPYGKDPVCLEGFG